MRRSVLAGGGRGGKEYPADYGAELLSAEVGHQGEDAAVFAESVRPSDSYKERGELSAFLTSPVSSTSLSSLLPHSPPPSYVLTTLYLSHLTLFLFAPSESLDEALVFGLSGSQGHCDSSSFRSVHPRQGVPVTDDRTKGIHPNT